MTTTSADRSRPSETLGRPYWLTRADEFLTGWRLFVAVGAVYLAYALFATWPLATNISGQLSAPNLMEDAAGTASYFAELSAHHLSPFVSGHLAAWNAPRGISVNWALNHAQPTSYLMIWVLVLAIGPIAGLNIFMLLGFVLSGMTMFAIAHRIFDSRLVAALAGFAFAFYPFALAASSVHYVFVHGWPLLLGVWRAIEMVHRPTRRNALLAGVAVAFAMWFNPYYQLLGGVAFATCLMVCFAVGLARGTRVEAVRACAIAVLPVIVLGVFFVVLLEAGGGLGSVGTTSRPIGNVYLFSAHLRDYLPGPYSLLFGNLTGPYLISHLGHNDTWDTALYPGYIVLGLAIIAFLMTTRALRANAALLAEHRVVVVLTSGVVALVAFVCSAPPTVTVFGFNIWMPSGVLFKITPTWQTFARFVILLEPMLILMMAAVLVHMRRTLHGRRLRLVFTLVALLLVVDLWDRQPQRTASTVPPAAYAWLHTHPGGIVADYPVLPALDAETALGYFWAAYDGHPLLEGSPAQSSTESLRLDLADLRDPQTAGKLAATGVRYLVVHDGLPGTSPAVLRTLGYNPIIIHRGGPSLWRLTSLPARTSVDELSGFDWLSGFPTYDRRLMTRTGVLAVRARDCGNCTGTVSFSVSSIGRPLRLAVRDQRSGRKLAMVQVPGEGFVTARVNGVKLSGGSARLELQMSPGRRNVVIRTRSARLTLLHG